LSDTLISRQQLKTKGITYSRAHLWRLERDCKFPRRVMLGAGKLAYVEAEVDAYIAAKIAERDAKYTPAAGDQAA
jgi:prophage regulatory protein